MAEHFTPVIASDVARSPGSWSLMHSAFPSPPHCFVYHLYRPSPPLHFSSLQNFSHLVLLISRSVISKNSPTPSHSLGCGSTRSLAITRRHLYTSNTAGLQWKPFFARSLIFQGLEMEYFHCPFHRIPPVLGLKPQALKAVPFCRVSVLISMC